MSNLSIKQVGVVILATVTILINFFFASIVQAEDTTVGSENINIVIDKTTGTLLAVRGKTRLLDPTFCGYGRGRTAADTTPNGVHRVWTNGSESHKKYVSKKLGVSMPYAIGFDQSGGFFIHGWSGHLMGPADIPVGNGCVRLKTVDAKKLFEIVTKDVGVGKPVFVTVSGDEEKLYQSRGIHLEQLFEKDGSEFGRMKIAAPNPTAEVITLFRKLWVEKKLFWTKVGRKVAVGYPGAPESTYIPLGELEKKILSPDEIRRGVHLTLD